MHELFKIYGFLKKREKFKIVKKHMGRFMELTNQRLVEDLNESLVN